MSDRKVCVVTGAAGGVGIEVVKKFYAKDYDVVMLDIAIDKMKQGISDNNMDADRVSCS